jgi:hypothetical protein
LRIAPSIFIQGDITDAYFQNEITLMKQRLNNSLQPRNYFYGSVTGIEGKMMNTNMNGATYCAYKDNRGQFRILFTLSDGNLSIKTSDNGFSWIYALQYYNFHVNYFSDITNNNKFPISNPYVVYDNFTDMAYIFYFSQNILFYRKINNSLLYVKDVNTFISNTYTETYGISNDFLNYLKISYLSTNLPIYITGNLSQPIAQSLATDMNNFINNTLFTSVGLSLKKTAIIFHYDNPLNYLSNFNINTQTTICGFILKNNKIRIMYKNAQNLVFGATINGDIPSLDSQLSV